MPTVAFDRIDRAGLRRAAATLAGELAAGDCLVLAGPLAAGKTEFVSALAEALGATDPVTSPTFTLAHFYAGGRLPVLHVDAYRLDDLDAFKDLTLDDFYESHVTAIEWGEKMAAALPPFFRVEIAPVGDDVRSLEISAPPARAAALQALEALR